MVQCFNCRINAKKLTFANFEEKTWATCWVLTYFTETHWLEGRNLHDWTYIPEAKEAFPSSIKKARTMRLRTQSAQREPPYARFTLFSRCLSLTESEQPKILLVFRYILLANHQSVMFFWTSEKRISKKTCLALENRLVRLPRFFLVVSSTIFNSNILQCFIHLVAHPKMLSSGNSGASCTQ